MQARIRIGVSLLLTALVCSAAWAGSTVASDSGVSTKLDDPFSDPLPAALTVAGGGQGSSVRIPKRIFGCSGPKRSIATRWH